MILDQIVKKRKEQLEHEKNNIPLEEIIYLSHCRTRDIKDFKSAIDKKNTLSIIAEVKKASPSKGIIRHNFNPTLIAKKYEENGASAISVLTEKYYFKGDKSYLEDIRNSIDLPILRKDFIIDPYQIYESKAIGSDAILLIASILDTDTLMEFLDIANNLGLHCLTEVHNEKELSSALKANSSIIGINNRDLKTFSTDLSTTTLLSKLIPSNLTIVSESGIKNRSHMKTAYDSGANAVLIGETLMKSSDIKKNFEELKYPNERYNEN